jgi:hypothetical protein
MSSPLRLPSDPQKAPHTPAAPRSAPPLPASAATILALQRGAGNQAVARLLAREPAATDAPAPDSGLIPALQAFWPDTAWSQGRLALDLLRPIPALGLVTGLAADVMGAMDDFAAIPKGDPVLKYLNYGLIGFRSALNVVVNGAQGLLTISQTLQLMNLIKGGGEFLTGVGAPAAVVDAVEGIADFLAGESLSVFIEATDGVLFALDGLIMFDAGIWSQIGPVDDRDDWKELAYGYLANALGDLATLPVVAAGFASLNFFPSGILSQGIDSGTALARTAVLARKAILSALQSIWNVRGGNALPKLERPEPKQGLDPIDPTLARTPEDGADPALAELLAAAQACYERGDTVLGEAAAGWAELLSNVTAMAEGAAGAPEALEQLRAELPAYAEAMQQRMTAVEGISEQLDGGIEALDGLGPRIGALADGLGGLALPLDDVPEPARGMLEPVATALDEAKATLLAPLRELQATFDELRPQLELVAAAAHDTLELLSESIGRVGDAAAHCDDIADFVNDVAGLAIDPAAGEGLDAAVADWAGLEPQIQDAWAAL